MERTTDHFAACKYRKTRRHKRTYAPRSKAPIEPARIRRQNSVAELNRQFRKNDELCQKENAASKEASIRAIIVGTSVKGAHIQRPLRVTVTFPSCK